MSTWRIKRQFNYLLLVILFFLAVGLSVYFIYRTPANCFDGKQNQNETGIDCGGTCDRVCSFLVSPLKTLWVRHFEILPNTYSVVALIENSNQKEGIEFLPYTVKLFDRLGREVASRDGLVKIFPQDQTVLFESNIKIEGTSVSRAFVEFSSSLFWKTLSQVKPVLKVSTTEYINDPSPRLEALINNETNDELKNIRVIVVLSDKDGNAYTTSATLVDNLKPLSNRNIFFTWPEAFSEPPAFVNFYTQVLGSDF